MFKLSEMTKAALRAAFASAALLLAGGAQAQGARALQSIDFTTQDNDRVLLTMTLSAAAPEPVVFTIDKPARLSLDLPETQVALPERYKKVNVGNVRSVAAAEAKGRTRVVVELGQLTPYNLRVEGNKVLVQLDGYASAATGSDAAPSTPVARLAPSAALSSQAEPIGSALRGIDFRRGERGEGRVVVQLANTRTPVDVREEGGKVIATFRDATIAERLLKRLDVLDFATPVKFVDARREGGDVVISVTPAAGIEYEQAAYQTGDQFTLEIQALTPEKVEQKKREQPQFTGERISLSFQNIDVRALLQIIADVAGTNMVVSDAVQGDIAMRLQNVPWDQALDIILRTKGLGMRQQGNVMLVAPLQELATRERVELESAKQKSELSPLRSEIIQLNYAKATDMSSLVRSGSDKQSMLSERGRMSVDERTNTLIILETREKIEEIRNLVSRLDIPVRQVLIESRIVIADDDYSKQLGVRFGVSTVARNGNNGVVTTSGSNAATNTTVGSFLQNGGFPVTLGAQADRYNVNLPVTDPAGSFGLAILGADYLVDLELSALQTEGRGEVVSTPRVVTANGKQASVEQGREIPYLESASSGAATISFKKAVLSLLVTPQITPDDRVVMDLAVTNDSQGQNVPTGLGGTAPAIDTRRLNTQVLVRSGETVVLGGVFNQESSNDQTKVPLLGDVPMLGRLFRSDSKSSIKRELLIFVTPKVLQEGLRVN
ncbi:type IV pilus secretin PilQ [Solimonas sp. SE-A11]|uniref:type IV pilus secretin PilQ n=1 Tax=Solimonas sp. SE-A11 TaxID=3054954 RepID=UPI00259CF70E|nr:type IV pilus secretin PilQ [Solimonas sp. SE-A11]MDM4770540.1 type IV pilus secretin PilQ [Solimonas sp. SE-A11]